jgi:hypothetical protein
VSVHRPGGKRGPKIDEESLRKANAATERLNIENGLSENITDDIKEASVVISSLCNPNTIVSLSQKY